jgi:hypothetical protein
MKVLMERVTSVRLKVKRVSDAKWIRVLSLSMDVKIKVLTIMLNRSDTTVFYWTFF